MQNLTKIQQLLAKIVSTAGRGGPLDCALIRLAWANGHGDRANEAYFSYAREDEALETNQAYAVALGWDLAVHQMNTMPWVGRQDIAHPEYAKLGADAARALGFAAVAEAVPA